MNISKKLFALMLCFFLLVNFQSAKADLSWGGCVLNVVGLCCDVCAFMSLHNVILNQLFYDNFESKERKFTIKLCKSFWSIGKEEAKKTKARFANKGVISLCLGLGCHALGSWLLWKKSGKKRPGEKLKDEVINPKNHWSENQRLRDCCNC